MLNDASVSLFNKVYLALGYTDLRRGIDVFSSIVTGALIQGQDFKTAVKRAVTFLDKAIAYTAQMELPWNYGICFEEYLEEI